MWGSPGASLLSRSLPGMSYRSSSTIEYSLCADRLRADKMKGEIFSA